MTLAAFGALFLGTAHAQGTAAPAAGTAAAHGAHAAAAAPTKAVAVLRATEGSKVSGTITFTKAGDGVKVSGTISGLTPGKHGFHVHEFGDCSAPDATSAGGHFNPTGEPHAAPTDAARHTGDLGNVEAGEDGTATIDHTDKRATFEGVNSILGRGLIVHAKADDLKTQPTGDAGGRVACAVIGVAKP
ncbi:MAG TPA: superoxide dismutase family protein [Candidatus Limnocylindrales bacterium]|nr:superoxide dismutase family protein [Candidatus Limnocylindrales bacterium]